MTQMYSNYSILDMHDLYGKTFIVFFVVDNVPMLVYATETSGSFCCT